MNISALKQSKFLTKTDVGRGMLVTIREVFQENVAKEGAPEELKWCVLFEETEKPMVLNSTNGQLIAQIVKSEETDNWPGHKIVLYEDAGVSFGGKLVGGIRARAPRGPASIAPAPRPQPAPAPAPRAQQPRAYEEMQSDNPEDNVPF